MLYISIDDYQGYTNTTLTPNGIVQFNGLLPSMQDMCDQYMNRTFNFTNPSIEYFDAFKDGAPGVLQDTFFPAHPISKTPADINHPQAGGVISLIVGQVNGQGGQAVDLTYVYNYKTHVKFWSWSFMSSFFNPYGFRAVQLTYNSDDAYVLVNNVPTNTNVPNPVKQALIEWCARKILTSPDANKETMQVQTGTVQARYFQDKVGGIPDFVAVALNPYRIPALDHF